MSSPARRSAARLPRLLVLLAVVSLAAAPRAGAVAGFSDPEVARAQAQIDAGDPEGALATLAPLVGKRKPSAEVLLVHSTALVMTGDLEGGERELKRALELDPTLRQGWLNLAGLAVASGDYPAAEKAFLAAQKLDPEASDSDLNLGVVALLQKQADEAARRFASYVGREQGSGEAQFLVAANYALVGDDEMTVRYLRGAISVDERYRIRARRDERFSSVKSPSYVALLETDAYRPPSGSLTAGAAFRTPYRRDDPKLLYAVLDSLASLRIPYEQTVEAVETWAVIWAAGWRIKVYNQADGSGVVSVTAAPGSLPPGDWERRTQELFRAVDSLVRERDRSAAVRPATGG